METLLSMFTFPQGILKDKQGPEERTESNSNSEMTGGGVVSGRVFLLNNPWGAVLVLIIQEPQGPSWAKQQPSRIPGKEVGTTLKAELV